MNNIKKAGLQYCTVALFRKVQMILQLVSIMIQNDDWMKIGQSKEFCPGLLDSVESSWALSTI